ncbi:hypothetical protein RBU49_13335 [Clostridium sp. MB40-C1]|uniref:hypothetical protein n=1 Tax=Clostridium sp. MB40-C1 TaxID=3070996 RepID=UPI0027E0226B|nr:hypothetical protein [Clostridium sp. MB40-C1]WMJ79842.1 hypothetical protein RBU49_13335 [Clostridium sp. MB40-C1]
MISDDLNGLKKFGKFKSLKLKRDSIDIILDRIIGIYSNIGKFVLGGLSMYSYIKYLSSILENEKEIHIRNNESLDKISEILQEELRREDISQEEKKDIYKLLSQISFIHRDSQIKKPKHVTSRLISTMGIVGSVTVTLGSVFIHNKYKTKR